MNRNNLHEFDLRKYEKHLSAFGCKVLHVLAQQNNCGDTNRTERNNLKSTYDCTRPHSYCEPSKCLNPNADFAHFNNVVDSLDYNSNNGHLDLRNREDSTVTDITLYGTHNPQSIPKSDELVKCVHEDTRSQITEQNNATADQVFSSVSTMNEEHYEKNKTTDKVQWEDMFDTELLSDEGNTENDTFKKHGKASKLYEVEFHKKIMESKNNKIRGGNKLKKSIKESTITVEDILPIKVKKLSEDSGVVKPNFRKQKYCKIVNKWLNDVDPPGLDDAETLQYSTAAANEGTTNIKYRTEITFNNNIEECKPKKTIQTQLSNKNGVMKFCKPENKNEISKLEKQEPVEFNKEKLVKSHFIPPVKSQIPLKELTYPIATIENGPRNTLALLETTGEEIAITLIYRNGFCQLNNQHTEDAGAPDGVMLLVKDKFYCITSALSNCREMLQQFLNNNSWVCYEGKNILKHLFNVFGFSVDKILLKFLDVKIGGSLLDPDNPPKNFSELQKLISYVPEFTIATECGLQKAAWCLSLLKGCWERVRRLLLEQGLWKVFVDIEMRVLPIISDMEQYGVCVDMDKLKDMEKLLLEKMKAVEQACHRAAGKTFQINSALQVRTILYDELQLDSKYNVKIRETICKGAKSTSETMLRGLMDKHPLPKLILEYRHVHKAYSTFLLGISQCVRDGVVKPVWEQSAAATGRVASHTPNLQAVPKTPFSLSLFPADGGSNEEPALNLRSLYVSRGGRCLLAADFRQVECRVLALAAGDSGLLQALRSKDLFTVLAATWLGKGEAEVSGEERERTKRVVYASMYGAGASRLTEVIGLGYDHALAVAASFNRTFPSLKSFGRAVVARCERDGKLRTPCGRTRHFKDISSANAATRAQAERKAINFIIQGSAADLCKTAMVVTEARLRSCEPPLEARLLLQIHDELVWEVRQQHLHRAAAVIKSAMEGCGYECGMPTVLPVALSYGLNWGQMKEFTPEI